MTEDIKGANVFTILTKLNAFVCKTLLILSLSCKSAFSKSIHALSMISLEKNFSTGGRLLEDTIFLKKLKKSTFAVDFINEAILSRSYFNKES